MTWAMKRATKSAFYFGIFQSVAIVSFAIVGVAIVSTVTIAFAEEQAPLLTFDRAIQLILARSTDIATQQSQVSETVATNITAKTAFLPNIAVQLGRYETQDNLLLTKSVSDSVNLIGKLNLFRFGADIKGLQAANGDEDTQTYKLAATTLNTEELAVQGLIGEIQASFDIDVLSGIVKKEQELQKIGRERYTRGLLPEQEVDKITVDMENASARLADTQVREAQAKANLVARLGNSQIEMNWPWIDRFRELSRDPKKRESLLGTETELEKRPDVLSAAKNLQAQEDRTSQRVRQILPTLDSTLTYSSYGLITQPAGTSSLDPSWTGGLVINIPLFDQLSNYSNARVQYFEKQKADTALELAHRAALQDWSSAKASFEIALSTALSRDETSKLSRQLYNDSLKRFRIGRIDANDLALDESRFTDSELLATAGWAQLHLAFAELCHARGLRLADCR
jgi:outer membrane protein TolC